MLVIPSARALREIIYSKRNSKRKTREGSTDVYLLKRTIDLHRCRNSAEATIGEDRHKPAFRAKEDKIFSSKRNLKRKSRDGSTDVYLLKSLVVAATPLHHKPLRHGAHRKPWCTPWCAHTDGFYWDPRPLIGIRGLAVRHPQRDSNRGQCPHRGVP